MPEEREGGLCRGGGKLNTTLPNLIPYFSIITSVEQFRTFLDRTAQFSTSYDPV